MSWDIEWKSIEGQIHEIDRLCTDTINAIAVRNSDVYNVIGKIIFPASMALIERIGIYRKRYASILSENALNSICALQDTLAGHFSGNNSSREPSALLFYKETFNRFLFDFNYFTSELDGLVSRTVERAFVHLQRTLTVNSKERELWCDAFENHETAVEALGSVHLLLHGIWAFKIDSGGQRTDLVLKESFSNSIMSDITAASEGLVLTEWKSVRSPKEALKKSREAFEQAKIYSAESLAEIELQTVRYLVLVSQKQLTNLPGDIIENGIRYKHVNIVVEPESPSIRARRAKT